MTTIATNPQELLVKSAELIGERGTNYGGIENNFQLIADLFSLRIGKNFHPYEVAILMDCVKNARSFANPTHMDNYLDSINYTAFAALFAQDYIESGAAAAPEITYKKKTEFKKAQMNPVDVKGKSGKVVPLAVDVAALDAEIRG